MNSDLPARSPPNGVELMPPRPTEGADVVAAAVVNLGNAPDDAIPKATLKFLVIHV